MPCVLLCMLCLAASNKPQKVPAKVAPPAQTTPSIQPQQPAEVQAVSSPTAAKTQVAALSPRTETEQPVGFAPGFSGVEASVGPGFSFRPDPLLFRVSAAAGLNLLSLSRAFHVQAMFPVHYASGTEPIDPGVSTFSTHQLHVVPALRVLVRPADVLELYGDAGLGLGFSSWTTTEAFFGRATFTDSELALHIAAGARILIGSKLALFIEPIGLNIHQVLSMQTQDGSQTRTPSPYTNAYYGLSVGASYSP